MNKVKFVYKKSKFEFTKSNEPGHYNMESDKCATFNHIDSLPQDISTDFALILENTLKRMEENGATKITMVWTWK